MVRSANGGEGTYHIPNVARIAKASVKSTKSAETGGRMMKAIGAGPLALVTAVMLAIAAGVAPMRR